MSIISAAYVLRAMSHQVTDRWFRAWQPQSSPLLRVFCLPYAGGQANTFSDWAADLGPRVEVRALQLPGRGPRFLEPPIVDLGELLDAIEPHVMTLVDAPFALFGHSMGAIIAFELAQRMRRRGAPRPVHVFLSGCCIPQRLALAPPMHHLPDEELIDELRRLGGTPDEVLARPELLELVLPWVRADLQLLERWVSPAQPPLDCPITALGGRDDQRVPSEELLHWRVHAAGRFSVKLFAGDHFYVHAGRPAVTAAIVRALWPANGASAASQSTPD
jgi:medium-chain acyl-[acyl-carrier-protein] hydrolase